LFAFICIHYTLVHFHLHPVQFQFVYFSHVWIQCPLDAVYFSCNWLKTTARKCDRNLQNNHRLVESCSIHWYPEKWLAMNHKKEVQSASKL
jgi:hypothetical protein